jgi:selenide,water dikinase
VVSVDYFTPIVRDAYTFGQIAAANALSDIYAMGAKPIIALNIVCFPVASMGLGVLEDVLRGSSDKLREAGTLLVGGHTVIDPKEIKYGLSVTGIVHPEKMLRKGGLKVGDKLILTKALGTGIINNALKGGMLDESTQSQVAQSMATLNKRASEVALEASIRACTDVTGFGLAGHLLEMIKGSEDAGVEIDSSSLRLFPKVEDFAKTGLIPRKPEKQKILPRQGILFQNHPRVEAVDYVRRADFRGFNSLTPAQETDSLLRRLHEEGVEEASVIGKVVEDPEGRIVVT